MLDKRVIYTNEDGGVSIVIPSAEAKSIEDEAAKVVPSGISYEIVNIEDISSDRTFRNAWIKSGSIVITDMIKARLITHNVRRVKRNVLFAPLDIQSTIPGKQVAAEAARQVIRNADDLLQIDIDNASDDKVLKQLMMDNGLI